MTNYFSCYSDEQLINIASELDKKTYPDDSMIRRIAKDMFNSENHVYFLMIAVPLAKEMALRLNTVSPHIENKKVYNICYKSDKIMETTMVTIKVTCEPNKVDNVIFNMINEGWQKDTNMNELTMEGKVKFEMWRKMDVNE